MAATHLRKNPSRADCESIIQRILMTEVLQHGQNRHFKRAADFMNYFESLYPASDALTKQVQRALQALDMPKDADGYLIANKTAGQFAQEQRIRQLLSDAHARIDGMEQAETVFLEIPPHLQAPILHEIEHSLTFQGKYITIVPTTGGLLFYTDNRKQLLILLESLG